MRRGAAAGNGRSPTGKVIAKRTIRVVTLDNGHQISRLMILIKRKPPLDSLRLLAFGNLKGAGGKYHCDVEGRENAFGSDRFMLNDAGQMDVDDLVPLALAGPRWDDLPRQH